MSLRGTGRTTRMLNDALRAYVDGWDIIVTGFTFRYALDLQNLMCAMLEYHHIDFKVERHIIHINNIDMIFTRHFGDWYLPMTDCRQINPRKTYLLFEDHFKGVEYEHGIY